MLSHVDSLIYLSGCHNEDWAEAVTVGGVGVISQPKSGVVPHAYRYPYHAADNGCFSASIPFNPEEWQEWLTTIDPEHCLFAVVPDVVGDAMATTKRFSKYAAIIESLGLPLAYVLQDGCTSELVPWDDITAVFTGGTDAWKESLEASQLVQEARRKGLWCHMGRVNGLRRTVLARRLGYQSVDGTYLKFNRSGVGDILRWLDVANGHEVVSCQTATTEHLREIISMPDTRKRFKGELTIADVGDEAPVTRSGVDLTQFRDILSRSWDKREANDPAPAIGLTVPADGRQLVDTRFRQAAGELGIGCTITVVEAGTERGNQYGLTTGQVRMIVEARPKKKMPPRANKGSNGSTPAAAPAPAPTAAQSTPSKRSAMPKPAAAKVK